MGELRNISSNEIALLDHCQELVSTIAAMQVKILFIFLLEELLFINAFFNLTVLMSR